MRTFLKWSGALGLVEIVWFSLMAPLFPKNLPAFSFEALAGLLVFLTVYCAAKAINWLSTSAGNVKLATIGAAAIALSVGMVIFMAAYAFRVQLTDNFRYFMSSQP